MKFDDEKGMDLAIEQAIKSYNEGGIPIGGALIYKDGTVLGCGHNQRIQKNSSTLHGEISTLENSGRLKANVYKDCTLYTTLSPCDMCTGAILLYGIKRVVIGENETFIGSENYLRLKGVQVINLNNIKCKELMNKFIQEKPDEWNEDIGE